MNSPGSLHGKCARNGAGSAFSQIKSFATFFSKESLANWSIDLGLFGADTYDPRQPQFASYNKTSTMHNNFGIIYSSTTESGIPSMETNSRQDL